MQEAGWARFLMDCAIASGAYLALYGVWYVLNGAISADELKNGSSQMLFPYFPHAAKIIAAWLLGWRAIFALLPATSLHGAYLWELYGLTYGEAFAFSVLSATAAVLAFETFRATRMDLYAYSGMRIHWRRLLLVGLVASLYNNLGIAVITDSSLDLQNEVALVFQLSLADMSGLVLVLLCLWLVLKRYQPG